MHSLYIHVPFCQKRCHYCSFYSTTLGKRERDLYVQAMLLEMQARRTSDLVTTVYFGGGTPSQLDAEELMTIFRAIRENLSVASNAEITFECNPDDVTPQLATLLSTLGVNRVSMGVQSFDDAMLTRINRRHTAAQAIEAIHTFHRAGIHNISIDLIYGLPGQSIKDFRRDIETATNLSNQRIGNHPLITHLSSYCLSIEEGTHLYNMRMRGEVTETDEETTLTMYNMLVDHLKEAGFHHYEISNFALPTFHSRHNTAYWQGTPYTGLGPGAHSYDGRSTRRWNRNDLRSYIAAPLSCYDDEHLTPDELYDELIMTRLRTADGLPLSILSPDRHAYLIRQALPYIHSGALEISIVPRDHNANVPTEETQFLRLTRKGIFISDTIFSDLMCDT